MCETSKNIRFCAVVQKTGARISAYYNHAQSKEDTYIDSCRRIIASSKMANQTSAVIENAAEYCSCLVLSDQNNMFVVYVNSTYPQRMGFQLLEKMRSAFLQEPTTVSDVDYAFSKKFKPWMKKLCTEYDDVAAKDKVYACQEKVDEVKQIMNTNIQKLIQNSEKLEELEVNAANLKDTAGVFVKNSKALSDKFWWQNARLRVAIAAVGTTVGLGIGATVLPIG